MHKMLEIATKFLAEQLNVPPGRIAADTTFSELGADCLDVVQVIIALEDVYDLDFPKNDLEYYPTLESLVTYLNQYRQEVSK